MGGLPQKALTLCLSLLRWLSQQYHRLGLLKQLAFIPPRSEGWEVQDRGPRGMWSLSAPHQRGNIPSLHFSKPPECGPASSPVRLAKEAGTKDHSWGQGSTSSQCIDFYLLTPSSEDLSPSAPTPASFINKEWGKVSRMCPIPLLPPLQGPAFPGPGGGSRTQQAFGTVWLRGDEGPQALCSFRRAQKENREVCSATVLTSQRELQHCGPVLCLQLLPACCVAGSLVLRGAPWFYSSPIVGADPLTRPHSEAGSGVHACADGSQSLRHEMGKVAGPPTEDPHLLTLRPSQGCLRTGWAGVSRTAERAS